MRYLKTQNAETSFYMSLHFKHLHLEERDSPRYKRSYLMPNPEEIRASDSFPVFTGRIPVINFPFL
jgi:hypothetical protein